MDAQTPGKRRRSPPTEPATLGRLVAARAALKVFDATAERMHSEEALEGGPPSTDPGGDLFRDPGGEPLCTGVDPGGRRLDGPSVTVAAASARLIAPRPGRAKPCPRGRALYLDLDGTLADFDRGVQAALGAPAASLHARVMWPALARIRDGGGFFSSLAPMPDAALLWAHCVAFESVTILTGMPLGDWADAQKRAWCTARLGLSGDRVITCMAKDKHRYCSPGAVLVDDSERHRQPWEAAGGTFILHTSAVSSIQRLRELGFV